MSLPSEVEIAALDRDQCGVQAVFTWLGDRYGHSIRAVRGGEATTLLEAMCETSQYGFPAAAPLQEAVKHLQDDSRPALLLTGDGDGRYWSATVTPLTDVHFALLGFDFACRRGRKAALPVVGYRVAAGVTAELRTPGGEIRLRTGDGREFDLWAAAMPTSIATESVSTCRVALTRQGVVIESLGSPHVSTRTTVQWRYEISAVRQC